MESSSAIDRVNGFGPWLRERLKGQPEAVETLDAHFGRSELGLTAPDLVRGGFLFIGPTGVGKTEATLLFAEYFFGSGALCRLNMSEFKEAKNVAEIRERLAKAKGQGSRVFLFDEVEKAHWEILDLLLQILDQGAQISAPDGTPVGFSDSYVVLTSNLGAREAMRSRTRNHTSFTNTVMAHVRRHLRPELLGRIESVGSPIVFRRLEEPEQRQLAQYHLGQVLARMKLHGCDLTLDARAFEYLIRTGFSDDYGARPLLGVIRKAVEGAASDALRRHRPLSGVLTEREDGKGLAIEEVRSKAA